MEVSVHSRKTSHGISDLFDRAVYRGNGLQRHHAANRTEQNPSRLQKNALFISIQRHQDSYRHSVPDKGHILHSPLDYYSDRDTDHHWQPFDVFYSQNAKPKTF